MVSRKFDAMSALWCWGRTHPPEHRNNGAPRTWNPLAAEMLSSSFILCELWDRVLPEQQRNFLTKSLGLENEEAAQHAWALLAGVSRVGEANPGRMNGFGHGHPGAWPRPPYAAWQKEREQWWAGARGAGLPLPPLDWRTPYRAEPKYITAATLPRLLGCDCADVANGERCPKHRQLLTVAMALHDESGSALHFDHVNRTHGAAGGAEWDRVRAALVVVVAQHIGIDMRQLPEILRPPNAAWLSPASRLISDCNKKARQLLYADSSNFVSPTDPVETWASDLRRQVRKTEFS